MLKLLLVSILAQATIYGVDDRKPIVHTSAIQKSLANSVAIMIPNNFIFPQEDGRISIETQEVGQFWNMCSSVPGFRRRGFFVGCTGFLIAPDLLVTAGHCMVNFGEAKNTVTPFCKDFSFLFDFIEDASGNVKQKNISKDSLYACKEVIHAAHDSIPDEAAGTIDFRNDFALIRLDRSTNRSGLKITKQAPKAGEKISMIGAPLGAPLLYAKGAVLSVHPTYVSTSLDSFSGNSGSPVFNSKNEVFGILVRGYPDGLIDRPDGSCSVINRCSDDGKSCKKPDPVIPTGDHVFPLSLIPGV